MDTQARRRRFAWLPLLAGTIVLFLAGCATPPPIDPASLPATPATFREGAPRFKVVSATPPYWLPVVS